MCSLRNYLNVTPDVIPDNFIVLAQIEHVGIAYYIGFFSCYLVRLLPCLGWFHPF